MATTRDDKTSTKPLPADYLVAIFDRETSFLYLYAQGKYATPTLTSFVELPWVGGFKFEFQGLYLGGSESGDATEHRYAQKIKLRLIPKEALKEVLVVVAAGPGEKEKVVPVPVEVVPLLQDDESNA
jgi:hypothetical protein